MVTLCKRSVPSGSGWLWVPIFGAGLASVLVGPLPGGLTEHAKPAALRLIGGGFELGWGEFAALLAAASWIVAKPLGVVGVILWLELRFRPAANRRNSWLAWAAQVMIVGFVLMLTNLAYLLGLFQEPFFKVEQAGGIWTLLLVSAPAFVLSLLVVEFCQYWVHRALHHFPFLWRFHSLHHSLDINVLNNVGHPIEAVMGIVFVALPTTMLIGVSQEQLFLLVAFASLQTHINHTRLPIHLGLLGGTLLCDNRYHYIHHSRDPAHYNKNFADRFPVVDMLFGTYMPPADRLVETGLPNRAAPTTLSQYLTVRLPGRMGEPAVD
jgi:sterol desaturase/sphingolipid hydroxylase (fatty acid hydroxylase superfamily)